MADKFRMKNRQINQGDKVVISGIYTSLNDQAARFVQSIPLESIKPFPGHPYHVLDNADMDELVESISLSGVQEPIQVWAVSEPWLSPVDGNRLAEVGDYILISGHRRKHACERLGLETIPAILSTYTPNEAKLAMVDANLRRERVLPSEKAYAYKIKYDALKAQGKRTDLTSSQVEMKFRADEVLAKEFGESRATVQRIIRLTELLPELLSLVDNGMLPMNKAICLSYMDPNVQPDGMPIKPVPEQKPAQAALLNLIKEKKVKLDPASLTALVSAFRAKKAPLNKEEVEQIMSSGEAVATSSQAKTKLETKAPEPGQNALGKWNIRKDNSLKMYECSGCKCRMYKDYYDRAVGLKGFRFCPYCGEEKQVIREKV